MGLFSKFRGGSKGKTETSNKGQKPISHSKDHILPQVIGFNNTANDGAKSSDMGRELFSFPKPETRETMTDYIQNHKEGDIFQFVAVTGQQEESKDSRLSRLRAYTSAYGKQVIPEMRINGVVLDMLEGDLHIDELKNHVDSTLLSKAEKRGNKHFKGVSEHVFKKPYIQLRRVTGEFVPLLSATSDYTDLVFSLQDGRLLDHQVIVQSNKIPTNSTGVFELSCDYCIPVTAIKQLSIKYELARPIIKDGEQWGSVSLSLSICESDTPFLVPKVEAMAIVKAPYTSMEQHENDLDHKDVTYTSGQIKKFRDMYQAGDIADNDEPKKERMKLSSYSRSSMRGAQKSVAGPSHLGHLEGWSQLDGMKRPLMRDGEASVSARSDGESEVEQVISPQTKKTWEEEQSKLRAQFERPTSAGSSGTGPSTYQSMSGLMSQDEMGKNAISGNSGSEDSDPDFIKRARKKKVGFNIHDV